MFINNVLPGSLALSLNFICLFKEFNSFLSCFSLPLRAVINKFDQYSLFIISPSSPSSLFLHLLPCDSSTLSCSSRYSTCSSSVVLLCLSLIPALMDESLSTLPDSAYSPSMITWGCGQTCLCPTPLITSVKHVHGSNGSDSVRSERRWFFNVRIM